MEEMKKSPTLDELFTSLERLVDELEQGETTLEESFGLYKKGVTLLKQCSETIDTVEKSVLALDENGELHEF